MFRPPHSFVFVLLTLLTACDQLGLNDAKNAETEGKAVGAACRHAGRALEDCYQLNPAVPKAAVFTGWREMNDYMTEQKLEVVKPSLPPALPKNLKPKKVASEEETPEATTTASEPAADSSARLEGSAPAESEDKTAAENHKESGKRKAKSGARPAPGASPVRN